MHDRKVSLQPMTSAFNTPNKPSILSPSAVVAGARNEIGFPGSCKNDKPINIFAMSQ